MSNDFVTAKVYPGVQNALVKNLMQQMKINDPNEACRRINSGEWVVVEQHKSKLLERVGTTQLSACKYFNVEKKFRKDPLFYLEESFKTLVAGKVEENVPAASYATDRLLKDSQDRGIIAELGGDEKKIKTFFCHIFEYLKKCDRNGQYIFYDGNGWVVRANWRGPDWYLYVYSVEATHGWLAGGLVVSREKSLT